MMTKTDVSLVLLLVDERIVDCRISISIFIFMSFVCCWTQRSFKQSFFFFFSEISSRTIVCLLLSSSSVRSVIFLPGLSI